MIVVDYIQLGKGDRHRSGTRAEEVGTIAHGLKNMAKELECPVLALSQLNRDCEKRPGGKPGMADLRESGDIEQDADQIGLMWREHGTSYTEVNWTKNRHGATGKVALEFRGEFFRFESAERDGRQ